MQQGGENEREKKPSKDGGGERSRKQTAKEILGERSLVEYRKKRRWSAFGHREWCFWWLFRAILVGGSLMRLQNRTF